MARSRLLIVRLDSNEYLILGSGVVVTFSPAKSGARGWQKGDDRIGIAKCEEVEMIDGNFNIVRHLNGDQTHQGRHVRIPAGQFAMQRVRLYEYR